MLKLDLPQGKGPGLGAIFVGDKGKIEINRNKLASNPKDLIHGALLAGRQVRIRQRRPRPYPELGRMHANPHEAGGFGRGGASCQCDLPPDQYLPRVGRKLTWNPIREEFAGDEEAKGLPIAAPAQGLRVARDYLTCSYRSELSKLFITLGLFQKLLVRSPTAPPTSAWTTFCMAAATGLGCLATKCDMLYRLHPNPKERRPTMNQSLPRVAILGSAGTRARALGRRSGGRAPGAARCCRPAACPTIGVWDRWSI